jgi:hypothetical protein
MPAGDRKYLLEAKRRLTFTSSSVVSSFCFSSRIDDKWYNVPRRPLTTVFPLALPPPVLLTVVTPRALVEADILGGIAMSLTAKHAT